MINTQIETPATMLVRGLGLGPLAMPPVAAPIDTCCAITGEPIVMGYPVADMVTDATNEFLDCFRGGVGGYVSDAAARCFKNSDPRLGNPTARAVMVFEDGTYYNPLLDRYAEQHALEAVEKAARKLETADEKDRAENQKLLEKARLRLAAVAGRPCWSDLVRAVWPERAGQRILIILTTDMKRRLWIRARVGALGSRTVLFYYDSDTAGNENLIVDWPRLIECLDVVETAYDLGFPKTALRESLYIAGKVAQTVGLGVTNNQEKAIAAWRGTNEFVVSSLIAQKREMNNGE